MSKHYIIAKFETPALAQEYVDAADRVLYIVFGDDNLLWVVTPAHAAKLIAKGFKRFYKRYAADEARSFKARVRSSKRTCRIGRIA